MDHKQPGYVLVLVLIIVAVSLTLVTGVYQRFFVYQDFTRVTRNQTKAQMAAYGGLEIALSQLTYIVDKTEKKEKAEKAEQKKSETSDKDPFDGGTEDGTKKEKTTPTTEWVKKVFPMINRWQTISLTEQDSGVDATLSLYIASEDGKIQLNQFIKNPDKFMKKDDKQESQGDDKKKSEDSTKDESSSEKGSGKNETEKEKIAKLLNERLTQIFDSSLHAKVNHVFNQLKRILIDPSELLHVSIPPVLSDNMFIEHNADPFKKYYFMDLFTTSKKSYKLNPWMLSASTIKALGLKQPSAGAYKKLLKSFKERINPDQDIPKLFKPLYDIQDEKRMNLLIKISDQFFSADAFSVYVYADVLDVKIGVYALLERDIELPKDKSESFVYKIRRLYSL
jgi:hypothetical protein